MKKVIEKIKCGYRKFRAFFKETYHKHIAYMYIAIAILITLFIEVLAGIAASDRSNMQGIIFLLGSPYIFLCNAMIVLMSLSITLLFRRRFFGICLVSMIWFILGVTNAILVSVRVTPFIGSDLTLIGSAFSIADKYLKAWQIALIVAGMMLVIGFLVLIFIKAPKVHHKINLWRNVAAVIVIWVLGFSVINLGRASNLITKKFDNLRDSYFDFGFAYCFSNSLFNMGVIKPEHYNRLVVKNISNQNKNAVDEEKVSDKPNIIFVQLESFFEVNNLANVRFSRNPIANFEQLMRDYPSGYMTVPVIGAGTVNTEFEVETGMTLEYFGSGEIPYNSYLHDNTMESICYNLKNYDYRTHAIHNNDATFYDREKVFSHLGYDTFDSLETMPVHFADKKAFNAKGWLKDSYLTKEVMDTLKSTSEQDFIYTITVQSHGKYDPEDYKSKIKVRGLEDESLTDSYEYYADQLYEVDRFIKNLTDELKKFDEHTIVVFYGDHLPTLDITAGDLTTGNLFQTPYVIWSNYDNDYFSDGDLYTFQLQSVILKALHMTDGKINLCHQANLGKNIEDYKDELHVLIYDMTDGDHYGEEEGEIIYQETDLQMGTRPIQLTNLNISNDSKEIFVYGKNFTESCKIYLNGSQQETEYIDANTLKLTDTELENGDEISLQLVNSNDISFYEADSMTYRVDAMEKSKENQTKKKQGKSKNRTKSKE